MIRVLEPQMVSKNICAEPKVLLQRKYQTISAVPPLAVIYPTSHPPSTFKMVFDVSFFIVFHHRESFAYQVSLISIQNFKSQATNEHVSHPRTCPLHIG